MKKLLDGRSFDPAGGGAMAQTSLPTGTALKMKLETTLATFSSHAGDPFQARVTEPVVVDGKTVIPIGTTVQGRVTKTANHDASPANRPLLCFPKHSCMPNGDRIMLNATLVDTSAGAAPMSTMKASSRAPATTAKTSPKSAWAPAAEC